MRSLLFLLLSTTVASAGVVPELTRVLDEAFASGDQYAGSD